ncbi:MAG: 50S ribosome-binding GTPase [Propionicimonas sp.]
MTGLSDQVAALRRAVDAAAGRSDAGVLAQADEVVRRAGERVAFDGEFTVVALAGATGSGKSSLFNALTGTELAQIAVRRPTTAKAMGVTWGSALPHELLDWLDIPRRHLIATAADDPLAKLVLLDLPDHDSTEVAHRLTVDKLVERVDALIWVVDPQKYADAALHDGYLKPLAPYSHLMLVVLNQADLLRPDELEHCLEDLRRLLDSEGLRSTPVMVTSALRGTGIDGLREVLAQTVAGKQAAVRRLQTDVKVAAGRLADELGGRSPSKHGLSKPARAELTTALAEAAGVPTVVDGVRRSWTKRGRAATGWPFLSWIGRLRRDPLQRLRLELPAGSAEIGRTALPTATPVQQARVEAALRSLTDQAASGLPKGWTEAVRAAARTNQAVLPARLDTAIAATDLRTRRGAAWWGLFGVLQWLLVAAVLVGGLWHLYSLLGPLWQLPRLPELLWQGTPVPTWLLGGGVLAGLLLALLGRGLVLIGAGSRARAAEKSLRAAIAVVTDEQVLQPVQAELDRYAAAVQAIAEARGQA